MRIRALLSALLLGVLVLAGTLGAQSTGRASGTVVDSTGAVVPNAKVSLFVPGAGTPAYTTETTNEGIFRFGALPPMTYNLVVEAAGFRKHTEKEVKIDAGRETAAGSIQLEVGTVAETVEVVASATTVQTNNSEVSTTVSNDQIRRLPMINRSPAALVNTQPGVSSGRGSTVINGQRTSFTNVTMDGINIEDNFIRTNTIDFQPNLLLLDQVGEFTVATSNTNSSASGGASQVIFVTPSGGNQYHGSVFWSNRNNKLSANTWFNNRDGVSRPFLNQNQAGGSVGGPILKDKLFFYVNFEAFRLRQQSPQNRTILTASARQGIYTYRDSSGATRQVNVLTAAGQSADATMQKILAEVPGAEKINNFRVGDSTEGALRNTAGFSFNIRNNRTRDNVTGKLDYNISSKNSLFVSYIWNRDILDRPDLANNFTLTPKVSNDDVVKFLSVGYRWNPTPRLTTQWGGGFNLAPAIFATSENFGSAIFAGTVYSNPLNTFRGQGRDTNTYAYHATGAYAQGAHNWQFGFQTQFIRTAPYNDAGITPVYTMGIGTGNTGLSSGQLPGIGSSDLTAANNLLATLAGFVTSVSQTFNVTSRTSGFVSGATNGRNFDLNNYAWFVQDTWKVKPRVTLNLGLRYELFSVVDERDALTLLPRLIDNNFITTLGSNATLDFAGGAVGRPYYNKDLNNFAPNVGLAWDIFGDGKTAVRLGYSVHFVNDETIAAIRNNVQTNAGLAQAVTRSGLSGKASAPPAVTAPTFQVPRTFADNYALSTQSAFGLPDPNTRTPYVQQWSIGIQREFKGWLVDARYVANHGTKLYRAFDYNQVLLPSDYLTDFKNARSNGFLAQAQTGTFNPAFNAAIPGSVQIPFFAKLASGGLLTNSTIRSLIQTGQVGDLASTYQVNRLNGSVNFFNNPLALGTNTISNYSNSMYNSFQIDVQRRVRSGLTLQANYTYGKVLADAASGSENAFQSRFEPFLDNVNPQLERARAPFDLTHQIKANYQYDLPIGKGHRFNPQGFGRLFSGWSVAGIMLWESGTPFSVFSGRGTRNRAARSGNNTAISNLTKSQLDDLLKLRFTGTGPFFLAASAIGTDGRGVAADGASPFNGQIFFQPGPGELGSLQRRMFSGPWDFNMDFSVMKSTQITERQRVDLKFDFSNVFNHPTFIFGDQNLTSTNFGKVTGTFFGRRLIQISAYYRF